MSTSLHSGVSPHRIPAPVAHEELRTDLTAALDSGARLTVLEGPSGTGKTTALAQWARLQNGTVVWVALSPEDRDATALTAHLVSAAVTAGLPLPAVNTLHNDASREERLQALIADLNAHPDLITVALDRAEHLTGPASEVITTLHRALRGDHRLRVTQVTPGVTAEADDVQIVPMSDAGFLGRARPFEALLTALPSDWQDALERLSVLSEWTDNDVRGARATLPFTWADLVGVGLPVTERMGGSGVTPHDLLLASLNRRARARPDWAALAHSGARHAERRGQPLQAISLYLDAGDSAQAARVAQGLTDRWERHADWVLARDTLLSIGEGHLDPATRALLALALTESGDPERGAVIARAVNAESPQATAHLALGLQAFRNGEPEELAHHVAQGRAVATRQRDLVQMARIQAIYHSLQKEGELALEEARGAVDRAAAMNDRALHLSALMILAHLQQVFRVVGIDETIRTLEALLDTCLTVGYTHRAMPLVDELFPEYLSTRRLSDARRLASAAQDLFTNYPMGRVRAVIYLANLALTAGERDEAIRLFDAATSAALEIGDVPAFRRHMVEYAALLLFHARCRAKAENIISLQAAQTDAPGVDRNQRTTEIFLLAHDGDWPEVLKASRAAQAIEVGHGFTTDFTLALLEAWAARELGILCEADSSRMLDGLAGCPRDRYMLNICQDWRERLTDEFIRRGWHAGEWTAVHAEVDEDARPVRPVLQVRTLGTLSATLNEQPLALSARQLELLTFVALHSPVTQDAAAQAVWADREPGRARASAQVTRSTLNAAAGQPLLVSSGERRNPTWAISGDVVLDVDVQALLNEKNAEAARDLHVGIPLPGSDSPWVEDLRASVTTHLAHVYRNAATTRDDAAALRWMQAAALLTQHAGDFEQLAHLAQGLGQSDVALAAQLAVQQLARGEIASLPDAAGTPHR